MQNASKAYKQSIKGIGRNREYIKATIGVINSEAQKNVALDDVTEVTYFSNKRKPFDHYTVDNVYATQEEDFTKIDGSMYFLPKENSGYEFYNNGIVSLNILGAIKISFKGATGLDIKGLTINFGERFPVEFTIENDNVSHHYTNNDKAYWSTEDSFDGTSYFIITPIKMINGNGRLRIEQFFCGIVNAFGNNEVISYTGKEYVSSITDTIPSNDVTLTVNNRSQYYNPDNLESALAYMEVGQEIKVQFGYDVDGLGNIEWIPEQTTYLKSWSTTDTEAKFVSTDRFDYMTGTYRRGLYKEEGISLYDLAVDVLNDAGITDEREFFIDPYLKNVIVKNPVPVLKHSEALQVIANAGRCTLYEDRNSRIHMQSSFIPDMVARSKNQTDYSHVENILSPSKKDAYAIYSNDFSAVDGSVLFLDSNDISKNTGYISNSVSNEYGLFEENPSIAIELEAGYVAYGLAIHFRNVAPEEFDIETYYNGEIVESRHVSDVSKNDWSTNEQFALFDRMQITFTRSHPNSRITIDNVTFGDITDYHIERNDITSSVTATRQNKIKSISVLMTEYRKTSEKKALFSQETVLNVTDTTRTVYFNNASYGVTVEVESADITAELTESGSYYAVLSFAGVSEETTIKYTVSGYEFATEEIPYHVKHNDTGEEKTWKNPLISDETHAKALERWLASYFLGDVDYKIPWRGDPRTDANDVFYLELANGSETEIRTYQNELKFSGSLSGTMRARKAVI